MIWKADRCSESLLYQCLVNEEAAMVAIDAQGAPLWHSWWSILTLNDSNSIPLDQESNLNKV